MLHGLRHMATKAACSEACVSSLWSIECRHTSVVVFAQVFFTLTSHLSVVQRRTSNGFSVFMLMRTSELCDAEKDKVAGPCKARRFARSTLFLRCNDSFVWRLLWNCKKIGQIIPTCCGSRVAASGLVGVCWFFFFGARSVIQTQYTWRGATAADGLSDIGAHWIRPRRTSAFSSCCHCHVWYGLGIGSLVQHSTLRTDHQREQGSVPFFGWNSLNTAPNARQVLQRITSAAFV